MPLIPFKRLPIQNLFRPYASGANCIHTAPSRITRLILVGKFVMVETEQHGTYFIDAAGKVCALPISLP